MQHTHFSLLPFALTAVFAQPALAQTWRADIGPMSRASAQVSVRDGEITVVAPSYEGNTWTPGVLTLDTQGELLRRFAHVPFTNTGMAWHAALPTDDGSLAAVGSMNGKPWMTLVDRETGVTTWDSGLTSIDGQLNSVCRNELGFYIGVGTTYETNGPAQPYLSAVDAGGTIRFRRMYGDDTPSWGESVVALEGGGLAMLASVGDPANLLRETIRITWMNEWGAIQAQKHFSSTEFLHAPKMIATADGGLLVSGVVAYDEYDYRFMAFRLDSIGGLVWKHRYDTFPGDSTYNSHHQLVSAVQTPDGGFALAVTQPIAGIGPREDAGILRLNSNGQILWFRTYGEASTDEHACDLAVTPDGGFVLLTGLFGTIELRAFRTDANGEINGCTSSAAGAFEATLPLTVTTEDFDYVNDPGQIQVQHSSVTPATTSVSFGCGQQCVALGGSYGSGISGSGGLTPALEVTDGACLGWTPEVHISQGLASTFGFLVFSRCAGNVPVFGGTLYMNPTRMIADPITMDGNGELTIPIHVNLQPMIGTQFISQVFLFDAGAAQGVSSSNAATLLIQ